MPSEHEVFECFGILILFFFWEAMLICTAPVLERSRVQRYPLPYIKGNKDSFVNALFRMM